MRTLTNNDTTTTRMIACGTIALVATLGFGCVMDEDMLTEEELGEVEQAVLRQLPNGLSSAYLARGVRDLRLPTTPLDDLKTSFRSQLRYNANRQFLKYTVECALSSSQSVSFERYFYDKLGRRYTFTDTYYGEIGFATGWKKDSCGTSCREKVTACVLARTNFTGATVNVGLQFYGEGPRPSWPWIPEGAFYGDFFHGDDDMYFCSSGAGFRFDESVFGTSPIVWTGNCHPDEVGGIDDRQACILRDGEGQFKYCATGDYQTYDPPPVSGSWYTWALTAYYELD